MPDDDDKKDSGAPNHGVEINSASTCTSRFLPIIRLIIDLPCHHHRKYYSKHYVDIRTLFEIFIFCPKIQL